MEVAVEKNKKNYFTQDTEDAIVLYNQTQDINEKSRIYGEKIHYAFFKLTQNIIHTFKFYHTEVENIEDLQHEVIIFLLSKIHKFNPSLGYKAYSYFGTITKRYLILIDQRNYKKKINKVEVETLEENEEHTYNIDDLSQNQKLIEFVDAYVDYCTQNIFELFPKGNDAQVADAILELFRKREHLDVFNKKALYIYIREMVDIKTPKITKVANQLHDIFKKGYMFYLEHGYINF